MAGNVRGAEVHDVEQVGEMFGSFSQTSSTTGPSSAPGIAARRAVLSIVAPREVLMRIGRRRSSER